MHKNSIHVLETLAADATDLPGAVEDRVETESEGFGSSAASSAGKVHHTFTSEMQIKLINI